MVIWIASYPRSGNTYFRILLKHFYKIRTFSIYKEKASPKHFEFIGNRLKPEFLEDMSNTTECYFVKTHELPQEDFPAIYLVRDGRDALLSYAWYALTFEETKTDIESKVLWKTLHSMIIDNGFFGGWGSHVLAWSQRQTPTVIVKFEDLIQSSDPANIVKQALHRVGYQLSEAATTSFPPTFQELQQKRPRFYRKGKIGSWKKEMPYELQVLFWEKHGEAMRKMGYSKSIWTKLLYLLARLYPQRRIQETVWRGTHNNKA